MPNSFFQRRPVLVTGADGFVGSHVVELLLERGAYVLAFVRNNVRFLDPAKVKLLRGDLADAMAVERAVQELPPGGVVMHLGAQAHVGESWLRPHETVASNILGTVNVLEACRHHCKLAKVHLASSSEVYGNVRGDALHLYRFIEGILKLREADFRNPVSVYGISKYATDQLGFAYHLAYGLPTVVARAFNMFGPRQGPRYVTGAIISQAIERGTVAVGFTESRRDFMYVTDGARAHLEICAKGRAGSDYVFGYGDSISISDWASLILGVGQAVGAWPLRDVVVDRSRWRPGQSELLTLRADATKLSSISGWKPEISWREGLEATIRWYLENKPLWRNAVDWERPVRPLPAAPYQSAAPVPGPRFVSSRQDGNVKIFLPVQVTHNGTPFGPGEVWSKPEIASELLRIAGITDIPLA